MKRLEKPTSVKILQWIYLLTFFSVIAAIIIIHNTPQPFLDVLRLPTFFRLAEPYIGISYISSMTVYHFTLAYFFLIIIIDAVSLSWYSNKFLKQLSLVSSVLGFFLFGFMLLYFLYSYIVIGFESYNAGISALIYLLITIVCLLLDLFTFLVEEKGIYDLR